MAELQEVAAAMGRLRQAGPALRARSVDEIVTTLGRVGRRFLDERDEIRQRALAGLPEEARVSPAMARVTLDGMAADWTEERLRALVSAEFADPAALDGFVSMPLDVGTGFGAGAGVGEDAAAPADRRLRAMGPRLCLQVVSGSVPGVGVHALIRSLLVKAPTLLKPGRGDALLPRLFAQALAAEDEIVGEALAVFYWPGGSEEVERRVLEAAEVAVIYGSDETVEALRAMAPATTRVVAYHHRVGVGVVGRGALGVAKPGVGAESGAEAESGAATSAEGAAADVARAVALFEQRGCVCPQVIYVEESGDVGPADFARAIAEALDGLEDALPSIQQTTDEASALAQLRGTLEMHEAAGDVELHHGGSSSPWTVVLEREPVGLPLSAARTIRIRPVSDLADVPALLAPLGPHLQSVGYAGVSERLDELAASLAHAGASRVVPFHALSFPRPWWLHDGRGPLAELVRWVEVEEG